ncbi:CsgG/HfaB family protein [uncultured Winogradskyella sp.]|uniref:CsgG/HfaB family protein n=1 Tax=uncultured Winogradskyella sp. TaxID=395353 RepID=UPI003519C0CE
MRHLTVLLFIVVFLLFTNCGTYFNQPISQGSARMGESTNVSKVLAELPEPQQKVVVGVYNFKDQTGQFKPTENGSTFSTAVTQGSTAILIKALEDSKWFIPTERENLNNLLNERQIIISTRQEFAKANGTTPERLRPLLFAGILLEGGIVSYDTNIVTGGIGARYFGIGGSAKYRQDRITIYLRAVSTSTGEILKTVYVSKTILSQALDANYFRFVSFQRLLEAETGFTRNEPIQLAVSEAVEKAVHSLVLEGIEDNLWSPIQEDETKAQELIDKYYSEKDVAADTKLYDRYYKRRRGSSVFTMSGGIGVIDGDLPNSTPDILGRFGYKQYLSPHLNLNLFVNQFRLRNKDLFENSFLSINLNAEFTVLPFDDFTPYIYSGVGFHLRQDEAESLTKVQLGIGLEYMVSNSLGITAFAEPNFTFSDELDGVINGTRDDFYYNFGIGLNFYLNSPKFKSKSRQISQEEVNSLGSGMIKEKE